MNQVDALINEQFVLDVLIDGKKILEHKKIDNIDAFFEGELDEDEYEFYIHGVGFYLFQLMEFLQQLVYIDEYISNFQYRKGYGPNRVDHLLYNIENYYIRLSSVSDRILQLINRVFHLCNDEKSINSSILQNQKIKRTKVPQICREIERVIGQNKGIRNQIVHRYSYDELQAMKLKLFYLNELDKTNENDKLLLLFRSKKLKDYIANKKEEFNNINSRILAILPELFQELSIHYKENKERIRLFIDG